ncbi:MAG: phosphoglycerate kinase [Actinobacteria bacterium]|uniref:phosphoglycerate kinase n=1 Tax=freshwater metagenome TaxID=449393 RepID=A0A6J6N155_9ZZZZ|nr:phosphoglycerate kinase [Actinomycetota bacterium]
MKTLADFDYSGKSVILRCDLNVPLDGNVITDDGRIKASLPTIQYLLNAGARITILAHLGRPKNGFEAAFSLAPVANRLSELLNEPVKLAKDLVELSATPKEMYRVRMLENIRFFSQETSKEEQERLLFATQLAQLGEIYVGDGFGAVHRKHASVYELPNLLPNVAGRLIEAEVAVLKKLTVDPVRPYAVVLGGAKVADKIGVISNLLEKVDLLAIGGGMVFTFIRALGHEIGKSMVDLDLIDDVKVIIKRADELNVKLLLPTDVVVAPAFSKDSPASIVSISNIPADQIGLDIGPDSAKAYALDLQGCETVFWNGPMGVFEFPAFANGTKVVAQALSEISGFCVVGGGDSAAAIRTMGFDDAQFGYISTGGGASLEYLEGKLLPGLVALES